MKQRKPLKRTEILRKAPLRHGPSQLGPAPSRVKPETGSVGAWKSSGPVKARRPGRPSKEENRARELLKARSGGVCETWVPGHCRGVATVWSHRKRRSQSSLAEMWSLANGLNSCPPCEQYLTDNGSTPEVRSYGWTVHPSVDPAAMPVLRRGVWVWLLEDGSVEPLDLLELAEWAMGATA